MHTALSVAVITRNEEKNVERCLESVAGVSDDVVVVDAHSTDRTEEICLRHGARFVRRDWTGFADQKDFARSLARHPYVLSLDADEALSSELTASIQAAKTSGLRGAYRFNRLTCYCGKWIRHGGWYPDSKIRLFPKEAARWVGEYVHETVEFSAPTPITHLSGDLLHYSYSSFEEHRERADRYSILTAAKLHAQGKRSGAIQPYLSAAFRLLDMYLVKGGFLDGFMGWKIATISAASNVVKYKELARLHHDARRS
jgi:hypothetical protein